MTFTFKLLTLDWLLELHLLWTTCTLHFDLSTLLCFCVIKPWCHTQTSLRPWWHLMHSLLLIRYVCRLVYPFLWNLRHTLSEYHATLWLRSLTSEFSKHRSVTFETRICLIDIRFSVTCGLCIRNRKGTNRRIDKQTGAIPSAASCVARVA